MLEGPADPPVQSPVLLLPVAETSDPELSEKRVPEQIDRAMRAGRDQVPRPKLKPPRRRRPRSGWNQQRKKTSPISISILLAESFIELAKN